MDLPAASITRRSSEKASFPGSSSNKIRQDFLSAEVNARSAVIDPGEAFKFGFIASAFCGRRKISPANSTMKRRRFDDETRPERDCVTMASGGCTCGVPPPNTPEEKKILLSGA